MSFTIPGTLYTPQLTLWAFVLTDNGGRSFGVTSVYEPTGRVASAWFGTRVPLEGGRLGAEWGKL